MSPSSLFVRVGVALAATITATTTATAATTDWVLSRPGGSCDEACVGSCHAEGTAQITSPGRIRYVAEVTGAGRCDAVVEEAVFGNEPAIDRVTSPHSHCVHLPADSRAAVDCAAGWGNEERFCCCGDDCPAEPPPAEAPPSCPKRHHEWVLSREGDSCDEACAIRGKPCGDAPGLQTSHAMKYVSCLLGLRCDTLGPNPTPLLGIEPSVFSSNGSHTCYYRTAPYTSACDGAFPGEKRVCCCGSDCPLSG